MAKYAQGLFILKHPEKYVGRKTPYFRSSWEASVMTFFDTNPAIQQWASEAIHINYRNPFTNKSTIYVPDFFIKYVDKDGKEHAEIIEVKPHKETAMENAKSMRDKAAVVLNLAKWEAARHYCDRQGLQFRIVSERDLFSGGGVK